MTDFAASESYLEILNNHQIERFADLLSTYSNLLTLPTDEFKHIQTAGQLRAAIKSLNDSKINDGVITTEQLKQSVKLHSYSQLVVGKGGELTESLINKNYKLFEKILQNNEKIYLTQSIDLVIAKNFDPKALKILLKNIPKYELSQTIISVGGREAIEFYLNMKGREQALSKELGKKLGLKKAVFEEYHKAAMVTLAKDIPRSEHLGKEKLIPIITACTKYHDSTTEKIAYIDQLAEKCKGSAIITSAIQSVKTEQMLQFSQNIQAVKHDEPQRQVLITDNFSKFCHDVAQKAATQATNQQTNAIAEKSVPIELKSTIANTLHSALEKNEQFKSLFIKTFVDQVVCKDFEQKLMDNTKLAQQLADIVVDSYKTHISKNTSAKLMMENSLQKHENSLQKYELNEAGKTKFIDQICHKVKKLIFKNYQAESIKQDISKITHKLTSFVSNSESTKQVNESMPNIKLKIQQFINSNDRNATAKSSKNTLIKTEKPSTSLQR